MKNFSTIVKTITLFLFAGMLFLSCAFINRDDYGYLALTLPGSDSSARAAGDPISSGYFKNNLRYTVTCTGQGGNVVREFSPNSAASVPLLPGTWSVTVDVWNVMDTEEILGSSEQITVTIEAGVTTKESLKIPIITSRCEIKSFTIPSIPDAFAEIDDGDDDGTITVYVLDDTFEKRGGSLSFSFNVNHTGASITSESDTWVFADVGLSDYTLTVTAENGKEKIYHVGVFAESALHWWGHEDLEKNIVYMDVSVNKNGVCAIKKIKDPPLDELWRAQAGYNYTSKVNAAKKNTAYTYVFEAWTDKGEREVNVQYYAEYSANYAERYVFYDMEITLTAEPKIYTIDGQALAKTEGREINTHLIFMCVEGDGQIEPFYVKVISITEASPAAGRWAKREDSESTARLNYSVDSNGVCTITVSGEAMTNNEEQGWNRWRAAAGYRYTAKANTAYTYVFEAWTEGGERTIGVEYYWDAANEKARMNEVKINSTRKNYTVTGIILPEGGECELKFHCGDQLGTFYVKVLEIYAYTPGFDYELNADGTEYRVIGNRGMSGEVEIPAEYKGKDVTEIGNEVFAWRDEVTGITIPASVTTIALGAFSGWTNSQTINVRGYTSEAAADNAWGSSWRSNCNAVRKYWNGSSYQ